MSSCSGINPTLNPNPVVEILNIPYCLDNDTLFCANLLPAVSSSVLLWGQHAANKTREGFSFFKFEMAGFDFLLSAR